LFHLERPDQLIKEARYAVQNFIMCRCSWRRALTRLDPTPFDQVSAIGSEKFV
jgi:hypothetical protein